MPQSRFSVQSEPNEAVNVNAPTASEAERLHAELVQRAGVEKPAAAGGEPSPPARERANRPVASVPQTPARPCTATAPIGSSMPSRSTSEDADDRDHRRDEPDHDRGPRRDEARTPR